MTACIKSDPFSRGNRNDSFCYVIIAQSMQHILQHCILGYYTCNVPCHGFFLLYWFTVKLHLETVLD